MVEIIEVLSYVVYNNLKNGVWHVMMFCSINSDIMIIVNSDGTNYAKYVSIISNDGERIEKKFTTKNRYLINY